MKFSLVNLYFWVSFASWFLPVKIRTLFLRLVQLPTGISRQNFGCIQEGQYFYHAVPSGSRPIQSVKMTQPLSMAVLNTSVGKCGYVMVAVVKVGVNLLLSHLFFLSLSLSRRPQDQEGRAGQPPLSQIM
jgi:hypothetical protein